jgi:hypothetical protein
MLFSDLNLDSFLNVTKSDKSNLPVENTEIISKNIIQFRNGFINLNNSNGNNMELAMTVNSELMQLGYILDIKALKSMSKASIEDISLFKEEVINYIKIKTGSDINYTPFWKNFPSDVMSKSEVEIWLHNLINYFNGGKLEPEQIVEERRSAFENSEYTKLTIGTEEDFLNIFTELVSVNNSLTKDDLLILDWYCENGIKLIFPKQIPFKENLCLLASYGLDVPVNTVTDVLRIAVHMSGGDISLPRVPDRMVKRNSWSSKKEKNIERERFKFKKFKRSERRRILELLNKTNCDISEGVLKVNRWIRLGEILHPGEYKKQYPKAFEFFNSLRNEKVRSWYSNLNKAFDNNFKEGLVFLSKRPGEFFRRVDYLVRNNLNDLDLILNTMEEIGEKVSNKVLFECVNHFKNRVYITKNRNITIKGGRKPIKLPSLEPIKEEVVTKIEDTIKKILSKKLSNLEDLGNVYVDKELENIPLPTNMRSLSSSLKPIIRGQKSKLTNDNSKVVRAFLHWYDEKGNMDLDLNATFVGDKVIDCISYRNLKNEFCYHSGDVLNREGACAEYIDVDIKKAVENGYKYVILDAINYRGGGFNSVKDSCIGYMEREFPEHNETFVPKTINNANILNSESSRVITSIIDLESRESIHLDIDSEGIPIASKNIPQTLALVSSFVEKSSFNVYDLIMMHVNSRNGKLVDKKDADTIFDFEDFKNSYVETLKLMGI